MDVNGTKFHMLYGADDWGSCLPEGSDKPLARLWDKTPPPALEWDSSRASLRLARETPLFRLLKGGAPLSLNSRRGAGRDRYGNWYWIDATESGIRFLPSGAYTSVPFWSAADREKGCGPSPDGAFTACLPPQPLSLLLRGLAVTTRHYLVVGDVDEHGLLVFDLHRGGPPLLLRWPDAVPFTPWDLAATPDGGLLVLDRDHSTYWVLDAQFRLLADMLPADQAPFQPKNPGDQGPAVHQMIEPRGYDLAGGSPPGPLFPISVEPGPEGHVLILEADPTQNHSTIYEYDGATQVAVYSLENAVEAMDQALGEGLPELFSVIGHDFVCIAQSTPAPAAPANTSPSPQSGCGCQGTGAPAPPEGQTTYLLYIADQQGKQAFGFVLDRAGMTLQAMSDFFPLRRWNGKALVAADGVAYYDFADRWVPLEPFAECHYVGRAVLRTPVNFDEMPPGGPFDSDIPGCVWHRLFLDVQIPQGSAVLVRARAADDPSLLTQTNWVQQPPPYLRSGGSELPYDNRWSDLQSLPEGTGTWELLFQGIMGRYLQLELTIQGTGRSTPALRALRAWFPRFSYLRNYLPALYQEDPVPAAFLDRWLANFEGLYTNLEDKIEKASELFDPRTAPAETLQWLACWFALVLDPLWTEERRRFLIRHVDTLYRMRGTVPGLEIAVRLYVDSTVDDSLFDPRCLGTSKVRIVERFLTRGVGGLAYGDPTDHGTQGIWRLLLPLTPEIVEQSAHRFSVLVPYDLTDEQVAMVQRIIDLEKPAHTAFELKRYWDFFRVGEARLGLDTRLGESDYFTPLLLGSGSLADTYLAAPYPFDIPDRMVLDRDRLGDLPTLS